MIVIDGLYFDGKTAAAITARLLVADDGSVSVDPASGEGSMHLGQLKIEQRLGGLPSRLRWPEGALFETSDHAAIEQCSQRFLNKSASWLMRLERSRYVVAVCLVSMVAFLGLTYVWGIPLLAKVIAPHISQETQQKLGASVLTQLDKVIFKPSQLSEEQQDRVTAVFEKITQALDDKTAAHLLFRHGGLIAANALALPGGSVIITDELVQLAENDMQLSGILLHEVGHLAGKHTIRRIANQSGLAMLSFMMYGDVGGVTALVVALPSLLLQQGFSRDMEREADDFAMQHMKAMHLQPIEFLNALNRLDYFYKECRGRGGSHSEEATAACMSGIKALVAGDEIKRDKSLMDYAATHPITDDRIARLRAMAE